jgi:hypothetical protein
MLHLLASESVVVAPPMSYAGAAGRSWLLLRRIDPLSLKILVAVPLTVLVVGWWMVITLWGFAGGVLAVPSRLVRGGSGKRTVASVQHRDLLGLIALAGKRS